MSRRLDFLLLRGLLAVGLGVSVVTAAATQAVGFDGELRLENGRVMLIQHDDGGLRCASISRIGASISRIGRNDPPTQHR